ncbi:MFS transporter [Thermaurantiacus sp.]
MAPAPPLGFGTKLAYGFGAAAYGVKDNGFSYFLLLFYAQVIGLDARLVGLALTIALVLDALSDPVVATWSDNLRSRFGRRHPFMLASAIPFAATYFLLWNPPEGASQPSLFWWLLILAIFIRTSVTFYEIPSTALAPELVSGYDERSGLLAWRYYFGWTVGNMMTVVTFAIIFPAMATPEVPNGQFNRESYTIYAAMASVLVVLAILVSTLGTWRRIPHLKAPPPPRPLSLWRILGEIFETLADRSFFALFAATFFGAIATGLASSLAFFLYTYFWRFSSGQIAILTLGVFASAMIGGIVAPIVSRRWGKKQGALTIGLIAILGAPFPMILRLLGILPEASWAFWFVAIFTAVDVGFIICFQILATAMMADLVEQAELKTGRRSEGIFFAATSFLRKLVTGLGITGASFLLAAAGLETGASPESVPATVSNRLALLYVPTILALWLAMIAAIRFYRIDRAGHEANLAALAQRQAAQ